MSVRVALPDKYERHRSTRLWRTVDRTIRALELNGDLVLQTPRGYVVGTLCHTIDRMAKKGVKKR